MAGFVTANRWATGVETHKTSEGRILCTGVGCVGCFPEVFSSEASELGLCDVDLTSGILGLRPFLDEENSRESLYLNSNNFSRRQKKLRTSRKKQKRKIDVKNGLSDKGQKSQVEKQEFSLDKSQKSSSVLSVATQTELSEMGIDAELLTIEVVKTGSEQNFPSFENERKVDEEGILGANEKQNKVNSAFVEVDDNVNKTQRNSESLFDQQSSRSRLGKILDKMYIVSKKEIALSSCDNLINEDDCNSNPIILQDAASFGEDAVCFFFALEYYNSQRILPHFRVMEIIDALSTVVALKDIKCVQRISGRWQIVLKSRKYNKLLRNCGLKLRGRVYELVDDVDCYFDVVP